MVASVLTVAHVAEKQTPQVAGPLPSLPRDYPVVIADGLQFFPLAEASTPETRSRIVYLSLPGDAPVGDATNQHQIERWKRINPALPVEGVNEFLKAHPRFFVVDYQTSDDAPARYLLRMRRIELIDQAGGTLIYRSRPW